MLAAGRATGAAAGDRPAGSSTRSISRAGLRENGPRGLMVERHDQERLDHRPGVVGGPDDDSPGCEGDEIGMRHGQPATVGQPEDKRHKRLGVQGLADAGDVHRSISCVR
jgi:hypothetical protein